MLVVLAMVGMMALGVGLPALFSLVLAPWQEKKKLEAKRLNYPQTVPSFDTVMSFCPFDPQEVDDLLKDIAWRWGVEFPDLAPNAIKKSIDGLMIRFIKNDESLLAEDDRAIRHIRDPWGRIVAGYHEGDEVVVVYNGPDTDAPVGFRVGRTALAHEVAHELDELLGITDRSHRDEIYGPKGLVQEVKVLFS